MGMMLQQILRSLCDKTGWCYAVFWKLQRRDRMMLTWEDGYCEFAKPSTISRCAVMMSDSFLSMLDMGENSCNIIVSGQDCSCLEDKIGLTVAKMSYQVFSLGEGIIGHVAFTGKHKWIYGEDFTSITNTIGTVNRQSMLEAGWQNQFAAGIKTIAAIAVVPHGVVQLGSTHLIMENLELVDHIKNLFATLQNVPAAFLSNSVKDSLIGMIKGPFLQAVPLLPSSVGRSPTLEGKPVASLTATGQFIWPFPMNESSIMPAKSNGPFVVADFSSLKTQPCLLSSTCSFDVPANGLGHPFQLQINSMQLNSYSPEVHNNQEVALRGRTNIPLSAGEIYPFQGPIRTNMSSANNQQTLHIASGATNDCVLLREQQIEKKMGLREQLYSSSTNQKNYVQPQMHCSIPYCLPAAFDLNSSEPNHNGRLMENSFPMLNSDEKATGKGLLDEPKPHVMDLKQICVQHYLPICRNVVSDHGNSLISTKSVNQANRITAENTVLVPVSEMDKGNASCFTPPLSSLDMKADYLKKASADFPDVSAEHLNAGLLEVLSSVPISSSRDGVSFSETLGIEQCWPKDILTEDKSVVFGDFMADKLDFTEVPKNTKKGLAEISTLGDDNNGERVGEFNNHASFPTRGQEINSLTASELPPCNELFQAFGSSFNKLKFEDIYGEMLLPIGDAIEVDMRTQSLEPSFGSACLSEKEADQSRNASPDKGIEGEYFTKAKSQNLLDAVVAYVHPIVYQGIDDNSSSKPTFSSSQSPLHGLSTGFDSCSAKQTSRCEHKQSEFVSTSKTETLSTVNWENTTNDVRVKTVLRNSPHMASSNMQLYSLIEEDQNANPEDLRIMQEQKSEEPVKTDRKKARSRENARPRPKDRQQIQDRLKELREIVPDGTKCSIDLLLERTIKHVRFLESVMKHADRLKHNSESKVLKEGSLLGKDNLNSGASWALDLDGQTVWCPIIVENLNQPRQMLVEILCEERGVFLEIADIIQRLGLTILKGVMEAQNVKIWAHFVVEANRDVHRMEILWSLTHLLQQHGVAETHKSGVVEPHGIDSSPQALASMQKYPISTHHIPEGWQ